MDVALIVVYVASVIFVLGCLYHYRNFIVAKYDMHFFRSWAFACQVLSFVILSFLLMADNDPGLPVSTDNWIVTLVVVAGFFGLGLFLNAKRAPFVMALFHSALQWVCVPLLFITIFYTYLAAKQVAKGVVGVKRDITG